MAVSIDINSDIGESFGAYTIGADENILSLVTSANIACGYHAGDPGTMRKTVAMVKKRGVSVGAHTGFPDIMGFGRRNMSVSAEEMHDYTLYQLGALYGFARAEGVELSHVKPHGAMYNMAARDISLALAICRAVKEFDSGLIILGLAGSRFYDAAEECGLAFASEVFADRAYMEDGSLVPRSRADSMILDEDEAVHRVIKMVTMGRVTAVTGKEIAVRADSVCVHGDGAKAVMFAQKIRTELEAAGIAVRPMAKQR